MSSTIETKCLEKGVRLTDQRKLIAKVMSDSKDHPDVDELHQRVNKLDAKIRKTIENLYQEANNCIQTIDFKSNDLLNFINKIKTRKK